MKHLLNALYVLTPEAYLTLDGENAVVKKDGDEIGRFPLHSLSQITCFSYMGASPALMGKCAQMQIELTFFSPRGRFLARASGMETGNVLLRRRQYRIADDAAESLAIAQNFIVGKLYNARWVLERGARDHALTMDAERLKAVSAQLRCSINAVMACGDADSLRGIEGEAASLYFSVFDELILRDDAAFRFTVRSRRPPLDNVNALLSFAYSLLANECAAVLEGVGLDPSVGMLHTDRPGRKSLALDLMEELRPLLADRFVLTGINNRVFASAHFDKSDSGAVSLNDAGRRAFLTAWKKRRDETITHPFLGEKLPWGLVPHVQALLLARMLRGDVDAYPPFLWK